MRSTRLVRKLQPIYPSKYCLPDNLIELAPAVPNDNKNDLNNIGGGGGGFTAPPSYASGQPQPMQYPPPGGAMAYPPPGQPYQPSPNIAAPPPFSYNIPPQLPESPNDNTSKGDLNMFDDSAPPPYFPPDQPKVDLSQATPPPTTTAPPNFPDMLDLPSLPAVPLDTPLGGNTPQVWQSQSFQSCFEYYL